ncbi:hypothetical protein IEU95_05900 [Hoyosella rhizosphaerae]|uniref:hypothetical protein n=1 Tax=Hoyosella rhizosphaerae TaxID=1755582 RepID=UPI00166E42AB|nr:hypothetical protein [Hoyosella rhizosphaerae]MBN4926355.1 hypothetical protein [Hoyosella rhizosphaerae]
MMQAGESSAISVGLRGIRTVSGLGLMRPRSRHTCQAAYARPRACVVAALIAQHRELRATGATVEVATQALSGLAVPPLGQLHAVQQPEQQVTTGYSS